MNRSQQRRLTAIFLVVLGFVLVFSPTRAATGSISFDGTGIAGSTCANSTVNFTGQPFGDTVDTTQGGVDSDYVGLVLVDATGQMLFAGYLPFPMGPNSQPGGLPLYSNISARPVTIAMFDIDNGIETASDWFAYITTTGTLIDQDSIDPATISPACSGLPLLSPFQFPGGGGGGNNGGGNNGGGSSNPGSSSQSSSVISHPFVPGDRRLNANPGASASVYCHNDGAIYVYGINEQARGYLSFEVSRGTIDDVGVPRTNTMLGSGPGTWGEISLWRLTSGEFQLHAPGLPPETNKPYDFVFAGCAG